ncbi:MAG: 1,4-alpha-glucan branching protein GlgB [Clostridia bacterium]|nr:1,4-alpha-glucan branching protein GlgB [Clostridia bacterium]MDD3093997.1 1,4-alpha-glucan branching protein GlgB [Clostridia bacterium]MDD3971182.1 1,4-alpha-glucan branching protein GlgB [Clostridia bacterium]
MKIISGFDMHLFREGTQCQAYKMFGAHLTDNGCEFSVYAPNAEYVSVVGDFNDWDIFSHNMNRDDNGIFSIFIPEAKEWDRYKYRILTKDKYEILKADPYAFYAEHMPDTASKIAKIDDYIWYDKEWIDKRNNTALYDRPVNIYELHFGSWKRHSDNTYYTYEEYANELIPYIKHMGYTHIELMPIMEYPFDMSWGYQCLGYFCANSRHGSPKQLKYFIDCCHQNDIGVILDWVPAHFPKDSHGLAQFDGSSLYEYSNPKKAHHNEWGTLVFDYGKKEVCSFLLSSAYFWLKEYHADGLRVDAVSSMLYLDYGRRAGEWEPNEKGGRENLEAVHFLRSLSKSLFRDFPNIILAAEESTAWPNVTSPVCDGGLGFNFKWNMGWMNDTLSYVSKDPIFRKFDHHKLTFSMVYAFSENYILPLSHDEVVHGKKSLLDKMPGSYEDKFSNLKIYYAYYISHPGKKLLFMGGEFGQFIEWRYQNELDWMLLDYESHRKLKEFVRDLNIFYKRHKAFYEQDRDWIGFRWINADADAESILSYIRRDKKGKNDIIILINFTPVDRYGYRIGVPYSGQYKILLNSSDEKYSMQGKKIEKVICSETIPWDGLNYSICVDLKGLTALYIKKD